MHRISLELYLEHFGVVYNGGLLGGDSVHQQLNTHQQLYLEEIFDVVNNGGL